MLKNPVISLAIIAAFISTAILSEAGNYPKLSKAFFIKQLKATHPFFKQQGLSLALSKNQETLSTAADDWHFNIDTKYQDEETNINSTLSKTLYQSGDIFTASHALTTFSGSTNNTKQNFALNYSKPLWRNKDGINSRLALELAQFDTLSHQFSLDSLSQLFLQTQLLSLIDLSLLQEQIKIHQARLKLANKEMDLVRRKFNAALVEKIDILSQKDTILRIKAQILGVEKNLFALKSSLSTVLSLPIAHIISAFDLYQQQNIDSIVEEKFLRKNHYQLKAFDVQKQKLQRQLKSNENQQNPDLSLNLGLAKTQQTIFNDDDDDDDETKANIGLSLSFPLYNLQQQGENQNIILSIQNLDENYQIRLLDILSKARSLLAQLSKSKEIIDNNIAHIKLAKERADEESSRYQNGLTEINFVISAQNNEQNARLAYANNAADYQKIYLNYQALLNQIK